MRYGRITFKSYYATIRASEGGLLGDIDSITSVRFSHRRDARMWVNTMMMINKTSGRKPVLLGIWKSQGEPEIQGDIKHRS